LQDDFNTFQASVNNEFQNQDRRISKIGAMGTATANMAMDAAGLSGSDRIGVGGGFESGQSAFSVGYQHAFNNNRANVSISGSFSNGESSVGVGAGFSW
jgi:autotransporter adhesin